MNHDGYLDLALAVRERDAAVDRAASKRQRTLRRCTNPVPAPMRTAGQRFPRQHSRRLGTARAVWRPHRRRYRLSSPSCWTTTIRAGYRYRRAPPPDSAAPTEVAAGDRCSRRVVWPCAHRRSAELRRRRRTRRLRRSNCRGSDRAEERHLRDECGVRQTMTESIPKTEDTGEHPCS